VWVAKSFRFVAEVEGLDVGEWVRSLQHLVSSV
jgi:hypothetical protein